MLAVNILDSKQPYTYKEENVKVKLYSFLKRLTAIDGSLYKIPMMMLRISLGMTQKMITRAL